MLVKDGEATEISEMETADAKGLFKSRAFINLETHSVHLALLPKKNR